MLHGAQWGRVFLVATVLMFHWSINLLVSWAHLTVSMELACLGFSYIIVL